MFNVADVILRHLQTDICERAAFNVLTHCELKTEINVFNIFS